MRLIIATENRGKMREIKKILRGIKIKTVSLADLDRTFSIKETGRTFGANAYKKAKVVSRYYPDDLVVGEDSGLEVFSLDNRPGVFSRRYSGEQATDEKNNRKLLEELEHCNKRLRGAQYTCAIAAVKNGKLLFACEGNLSGIIGSTPKGRGGFGYDPVFYLARYKKTVAQLPLREKNKISHRARGFKKFKKFLARYLKTA
ncbi:MAG: RdgB/HAM1 family non-canonical purine NTP pyrophosphatase [Candidatus Omnitrophica bacterium]|nr:RdgB/HAM1 family non-canonical purine NTP pyrophosphatase [Candidatus Omnitrophota bacterium]